MAISGLSQGSYSPLVTPQVPLKVVAVAIPALVGMSRSTHRLPLAEMMPRLLPECKWDFGI